ncbi:hypothetical protein EVAR_67693_1 [Eumeta japonica]|uniref:Uncharacterized protein n=1 Tax=Eumeta variegata TaxID=151549 RepID=A0A4C1ZM85_EUMVA|nr:hypothetical protein EVAR_67693_1 [Eumeta japonica]
MSFVSFEKRQTDSLEYLNYPRQHVGLPWSRLPSGAIIPQRASTSSGGCCRPTDAADADQRVEKLKTVNKSHCLHNDNGIRRRSARWVWILSPPRPCRSAVVKIYPDLSWKIEKEICAQQSIDIK